MRTDSSVAQAIHRIDSAAECRPLTRDDIDEVALVSRGQPVFELGISNRHGSVEEFLTLVFADQSHSFGFRIGDDPLLGWACCSRYHPRAGYNGIVLLTLHASEQSQSVAQSLYAACESECRRRDMRKIVAFVHPQQTELMQCCQTNDFRLSGEIALADAENLRVFEKDLLP